MYTTVKINTSTSAGIKAVRELEKKKYATVEYPSPELSGTWVDFDEMIEEGFDDLSSHYGSDMRTLSKVYFKKKKKCHIK